MIDTAAVPFLMKAVDFLFNEVSKILDERRERSKTEHDQVIQQTKTEGPVEDKIQSMDEVMKQSLSESLVSKFESEVNHLLRLLEIYQRNYNLAKEQHSTWGNALVPQIIVHNLTESEDNILQTASKLQDVLSKIYEKRVEIINES